MQKLIMCGFFLAFILLGMSHSVVSVPEVKVFNIPRVNAWSGSAVIIQSDGSVTPPNAPIQQAGNVYSLIDNIISNNDGIIVETNNVILDGNGYTIQGSSIGGGVDLTSTSDVTVEDANIKGFSIGIFAPFSNYDTITGNDIQQNSLYGIYIDSSSNDGILGNSIEQNALYGIWLSSSSNNNIYHNNFVNNTQQIFTTYDEINIWNDCYPSGGNYWSDYITRYPNAAEIDNSHIWNTPYMIDNYNQDNYPLMNPWSSSQLGGGGSRMPYAC
jgi:parallel beta-helix repeat protein